MELVNRFSGRAFDERDLETLSVLAPLAATAIELAASEGGEPALG
jgi:GAF domain-containing protein